MGRPTKRKLTAFAKALKKWRLERGFETQDALAEELGFRTSSISHWETDRPPSADLLLALEFDLDEPVRYEEIWKLVRPLLVEEVRERYQRNRDRIIRIRDEAGRGYGLTKEEIRQAQALAEKLRA